MTERVIIVSGAFGAVGRAVVAGARSEGARVIALDYAEEPPEDFDADG